MSMREVTLSLDKDLLQKAEEILDGVGGLQIGVSIFLSKVVKENSFMFLFNENKDVKHLNEDKKNEESMTNKVDIFDANCFSQKTKKAITKEMRDYVWTVFKQMHARGGVINQRATAKIISNKTGMNEGSAYIYTGILMNFFNGEASKWNMKFSDLKQYVKYIEDEYSDTEFENTLLSLEKSLPYWREHFPNNFSNNVESLIKYYRN